MQGPPRERINIASGSMWEPLRGYSRAVRINDHLYISGTTAVDSNGDVVGVGDPYEQTRYVLQVINNIVRSAGFDPYDLVRTKLYVTDISRWEEYARAHREAFESVRPASSMVQVTKLVDPRLMIEVEAEAILGCQLKESITIDYPER